MRPRSFPVVIPSSGSQLDHRAGGKRSRGSRLIQLPETVPVQQLTIAEKTLGPPHACGGALRDHPPLRAGSRSFTAWCRRTSSWVSVSCCSRGVSSLALLGRGVVSSVPEATSPRGLPAEFPRTAVPSAVPHRRERPSVHSEITVCWFVWGF